MWFSAFIPLLLLLLASFVFSFCTAWLVSSNAIPLRWWSLHPWKVFWASFIPMILGAILLALGMSRMGLLLLVCAFLPMYLSATQGLRVTWHRSPKRAVFLVAAVLAIMVAGNLAQLSKTGNLQQLDMDLFAFLLVVAWWVLLAIVTDRFARRLAARGKPTESSH